MEVSEVRPLNRSVRWWRGGGDFGVRTRGWPGFAISGSICQGVLTWRFMGSYKWGYKSPNMSYKYTYPTYNSTYNYP